MQHTYEIYDCTGYPAVQPKLVDTSTRFDSMQTELEKRKLPNFYVNIEDNINQRQVGVLHNMDEVEEYRQARERAAAWKPFDEKETGISFSVHQGNKEVTQEWVLSEKKAADPVAGMHYKNYMFDLQWLEAMQHIPRYRDPAVFEGAVELQVRKYMDRLGRKDEDVQELMKGLWYLEFLIAYKKNGGPIRYENIKEILYGKPVNADSST